ncbi:MAG: enoyl-CoA hydratase [Sandaracinaceae bacterium]|nr:MAG: enoyl-CoA hydratase [Sandaracinaceae bacterium]
MSALREIEDGIWAFDLAPEGARPWLGPDLPERLRAVAAEAESDAVRAVVVLGGENEFCLGAPLASLQDQSRHATRYAAEVPGAMGAIPVPVIAAMSGHAIGGGFTLGLLGDGAVLSRESLYGANFMALGFPPGMGTTAVLPWWLGPALAHDMMFSGRLVTGEELRVTPLAPYILPRESVRAEAIELARRMTEAPRASVVALRRMLAGRRADELARAVAEERAAHEALFARDDVRRSVDDRYGA